MKEKRGEVEWGRNEREQWEKRAGGDGKTRDPYQDQDGHRMPCYQVNNGAPD